MSRLKPMIIVLLVLTTALAGCVDRDNHPDHHDEEPAFITTVMEIIIISMMKTMRQTMLNPIGTIVMMIRTNPRQTANDHGSSHSMDQSFS